MKLTQRNIDILKIIIDEYIETGSVIGSKLLLQKHDLGVSPATVRNDMAKLESLGLIYQPYNSAGRLPSSKGLRAFVNYMMTQYPDHFISPARHTQNHSTEKLLSNVHTITFDLSQNTGEIAFFVIPEENICESTGKGIFLEKNYTRLGESIFSLIKMLEDKRSFEEFIMALPNGEGINVYIGEENIIPYLKDYTIIVKQVYIDGKKGYIGIIGSLQMDYSFNISAIKGVLN
ncbi:DeoR family transcriptional regulator [Candidatus Gracilibacteria bacterium]|nr:DeoR family transcriptional regulator [Candidatus Gracilibacteria bacterium]